MSLDKVGVWQEGFPQFRLWEGTLGQEEEAQVSWLKASSTPPSAVEHHNHGEEKNLPSKWHGKVFAFATICSLANPEH